MKAPCGIDIKTWQEWTNGGETFVVHLWSSVRQRVYMRDDLLSVRHAKLSSFTNKSSGYKLVKVLKGEENA